MARADLFVENRCILITRLIGQIKLPLIDTKNLLHYKMSKQSMKRQYGRMIQYLQCLPITTLAIDNIEADDAIAYIANEVFTEQENKATIVSTDRDFLQLVNNRISVWSPIKKKMYTPSVMREEFGIDAKNYLLI
jgi:5'-3' exonuclease